MPRRRHRAGLVASSSRSASESPELAATSPQEFNELKEVVQSMLSRLEVLEKVFVFVDLEQINDVLAKYHAEVPPGDKAGIDDVLADCQWQALPLNRIHLDQIECIPEETGENCDATVAQSSTKRVGCSTLRPTGGHQNLQELSKAIGDDLRISAQSHRVTLDRSGPEVSLDPGSPAELKQCIWDAPPQSVLDEDDQKSTCSTWDLCSTRDGFLEAEAEVEPELFHKFMKQALRPKWEMNVQTTGKSTSDDAREAPAMGTGRSAEIGASSQSSSSAPPTTS